MNSILKKTLVAVAVASAASANAATISSVDNGSATGIQQVISSEGLSIAGGTITTGNEGGASTEELQVSWTPAINHADGDAVIFTVTNAAIHASSAVSSLRLVDSTGTEIAGTDVIGLDHDDGTVTVSISDASLGSLDTVETTPLTFYVDGLVLDLASATGVVVSSFSQRNQIVFDQASATSIATIASQWTLGATADDELDGEIDVTASRFVFTNADSSEADTSEDTFDITVATGSHLYTAVATSVVHTLSTTGNFDFTLDSDGDFDTATIDSTVTGAAAITEALNDDQDELTITATGDVDNVQGVFVIDVPGDVTLVESTFSASTAVNYELSVGSGSATPGNLNLGTTAIGGWTLSGTSHFIEFMPYGSGIANFIYVANTGSVDAGVELTAISDDGETADCGELGVDAAANSVTNLGAAVNTALATCGLGNSGDRLALTLTFEANASDIDVTAGYNSRGDRVLID